MRAVTSQKDLQMILAAGEGYLANKKESGGTFVVHDLQHLHGARKAQLGYSPQDYLNSLLRPPAILPCDGEPVVGIPVGCADNDKG